MSCIYFIWFQVPITGFKDYWAKLRPILKHFLLVVKNYIRKSPSQLECLSFLESYWIDHTKYAESVPYILKFLYDEEVLAEENILSWYNDSSNQFIKKHVRIYFLKRVFKMKSSWSIYFYLRLKLSSGGCKRLMKKVMKSKIFFSIDFSVFKYSFTQKKKSLFLS